MRLSKRSEEGGGKGDLSSYTWGERHARTRLNSETPSHELVLVERLPHLQKVEACGVCVVWCIAAVPSCPGYEITALLWMLGTFPRDPLFSVST